MRKSDITFQGIPLYFDEVIADDVIYLMTPLSSDELLKLRAEGLDVFNVSVSRSGVITKVGK